MKLVLMTLILFSSFSIFAAKAKISTFQKVLNECYGEEFATEKISDLAGLYATIERKYALNSSSLLERETLYKEKNDARKLKYSDDKWSISRVQDDDTLVSFDNGMRQKSQTAENLLSQLLIHANIQSDYVKTKEIRAGQRIVVLGRQNKDIKSLQFEKWQQKKLLDCSRHDKGDICSCRESK